MPESAATKGKTIGGVRLKDWIAVLGAVVGAFMAVLDIQITNASLKYIQGGIAASLDQGTWISTGYLVAEIIAIPMAGWLGGIFSLRRYLLVNAALFIGFSMLCGMADSLGEMVMFRVGQGLTGGVLIPTAMTIILTKLPKEKQPIGLAMFAITATFAPAIGPTIGGWLTDTYNWRYIFYVNLPPGCLLMAMIWYGLDPEPMQLDRLKHGDWFGMIAMAIGLGSLECVLEEGQRKDWFGSPLIRNLAIASAIGLVTAITIELTRKEPFINLRLLSNRSFAACCAGALLLGFGLYGSVYIIPVYLGNIQGYDALQIGQVIMWMGLPQLLVIPFLPLLMRHVDPRIVCAVGMGLFAISNFMNTSMTHDTANVQLRFAMLVRVVGQPLIITPLTTLATAGIASDQAAGASGLFNVMRNLGGSIGIAMLQTFAERREHFHFDIEAAHVTDTNPLAQAAIQSAMGRGAPAGDDPRLHALAQIAGTVRREAYVLAYADCFWIMGVAMALSVIAVFFIKRPKAVHAAAGE
jgi:DHA2 family multidrug resistance protein